MKDRMNMTAPKLVIAPAANANLNTTPLVGTIIDRQGYDSLTFKIATGVLSDVNATYATTMDHGDAADLVADGAAVTDPDDIIGTLALASFTFADDNKVFKVGYRGIKRYVRLTITPTGADSGNSPICVIADLGDGAVPTANPPA